MVGHGLQAGGFVACEDSLERFADFTWKPSVFDLTSPSAWSGRRALDRAAEVAREKASHFTYELGGPEREQLERTMARARKELA